MIQEILRSYILPVIGNVLLQFKHNKFCCFCTIFSLLQSGQIIRFINIVCILFLGDLVVSPACRIALKNIDIALIAVSGTYVMTAEEAAQAVNSFKPKLAIPMHYSEVVGTEADANKFKELAEVPVEILKKE